MSARMAPDRYLSKDRTSLVGTECIIRVFKYMNLEAGCAEMGRLV
jgi:hypothetical protein